jgi:hypothetical protein
MAAHADSDAQMQLLAILLTSNQPLSQLPLSIQCLVRHHAAPQSSEQVSLLPWTEAGSHLGPCFQPNQRRS